MLLLVSLVLERSPVLDHVSGALLRGSQGWAIFRFASVTCLFSAFLNNTAVVGALLGVVTRQRHHPASKLLIPLSYAAVFGGVTTLIGTSTNLVVSSFMVNAGLPPLGMFDPIWVGVPVALVCLVVMSLGARLLPAHDANSREAQLAYFLEARVEPGSAMAGRSIEQNRLRSLDGLFLLEIVRDGRLISPVTPAEVLEVGDVLIFTGEIDKVQALQRFDGLQVFGVEADSLLRSNLVEVVVLQPVRTGQPHAARRRFPHHVRRRRGRHPPRRQAAHRAARAHSAARRRQPAARRRPGFQPAPQPRPQFSRAGRLARAPAPDPAAEPAHAGRLRTGVRPAAIGVLSLFSGLMLLMAALLLGRLLTLGEMRRRFPFDLVLVIGSALTIAQVLESSGAAALVAGAVRSVFDGHGAWGTLIGVYLLTVLLTELVTNNAAAALAFPIAISTARALDVDPMPFVMVVLYGASACFIVPFGYQTHLMVYSPGRYRMLDFVRAGLPVSIAYGCTVLLLVPVFFPFTR
jgi:di/tricarboxylate transporter